MADRQTRKQALTAQRREQITTAALEVFSRKGFAAATIPEIARQAGLAPGTLYLYFANKRDLFINVIEALLATPLVSIFEKGVAGDINATFKAALDNRLTFFQSGQLSSLMLLMSEIQRDPELKSLFNETLIQPLFKRMSRVFQVQVENGVFRTIDPDVIVRLVGGMMIGIALVRNLEGESSPFHGMTLDRMTQEILEFVTCGVLNRDAVIPPTGGLK